MHFKDILENEFTKYNWSIIAKGSINEWYEDEHWVIQWKHKGGIILYVQFLLCPLNHMDYVWGIKVKQTLNNEKEITYLSKSKRNFLIKVKELVNEVELYRRNKKK